jgi:hypothetical protein
MFPGQVSGCKYLDGAFARRDHSTVSERHPLAFVPIEQLISRVPIQFLILTPVRMNPTSDLRR